MNEAFEKAYKSLNTEQKRAVDAIEGPVMVVAGPGTGKTQMLTLRIANILKQTDASPDSILALTFTESGVHSMRERLFQIIGTPAYRLNIFTFHSFCQHIIIRYPEEFPNIVGSKLADDIGKFLLMQEALQSVSVTILRPLGNPTYYLSEIISGISNAKREYITAEEIVKWAKQELQNVDANPDAFHRKGKYEGQMKGAFLERKKKLEKHLEFAAVYQKYQDLLRERHVHDFDDMIVAVVSRLQENEDFLRTLQEEYQYLLADEHQDANASQNKLLNLLASYYESPNIFVVGDPDQAIYRFQGASLANFLSFKKEYPDAAVISLRENYRSRQEILNTIANLSGKDDAGEGEGPLHAAREKDAAKITILETEDILSEEATIADLIEKDIKEGEPPEEIAVLFRRNRDSTGISKALLKKGILFAKQDREDILNSPLIYDFSRLIHALANYGNDALLAEALHASFFEIDPLDRFKLLTERRKRKTDLYSLLGKKNNLKGMSLSDPKKLQELGAKFNEWKKAEADGLMEALEKIASESGFLSTLLSKPNSLELIEQYRTFFKVGESVAREHPHAGFGELSIRLNLLEEHNIKITTETVGMKKGVRLMTAHRSKGLEFNRVYVMGAVENIWEKSRSRGGFNGIYEIQNAIPSESEDSMSDELHLFYVALSRARHALTVSYAGVGENGKPTTPSIFVEEIGSNIEKQKIEGQVGNDLLVAVGNEPPQLQKEYLQNLFIEEGLSATALGNYLKDPWLYFFRNLIRIPEHPEPHLLFGTAIHASLERFFRGSSNEEKLLPQKLLLQFFEEEIERMDLTETALVEAKRRGSLALQGYIESKKEEWSTLDLSQTKNEVSIVTAIDTAIGNIPLRGKLDRLDRLADGLMVSDYKTGKPKSRNDIEGKTASSEGDYKRQLVFYKLLLSLNGNDPLKKAVLDFVEPDPKGKYHSEVFEISESEVEELKKTIDRVVKEIFNLSFWNAEPDKKNPYKRLVEKVKEQKV